MARYNVLYENASGYSLFRVKEFEELAAFMPQVQRAATDLVKFRSLVQLVAFQPFKSQQAALDNANSISEGVLHEDLRLFLETNAPTSNKKEKYILGVGDSKIGETIKENLGLSCQNTGIVPEVIRGIRQHASSLIDGMDAVAISSAELSLGRSYSRAKVKFNVNRVDNMIIQSIALIDQLDKDINTFSMRLREWYGYHFPELYKIVGDNYTYTRCVLIINNRLEALEEEEMVEEQLQKALNDDAKVQTIMAAMKSSMGMDIAAIDLNNIKYFSKRVISLVDYRKNLLQYLKNKMNSVAPNLAALIGDIVGARLISHAGCLTNLAKYPASTVQILGAEKALFRALKTRGNTPKYGLIFHSTFIGRAESRNKGRISRFLANKCSMASRIDCFSELASDIYGNKLKEQVEERLRFYTGGQKPKRNIDVMLEAGQEVKELAMANVENDGTSSEKKKKKKKRKSDQDTVLEEVMNGEGLPNGDEEEVSVSPKKKKKKKSLQAAGQAVE